MKKVVTLARFGAVGAFAFAVDFGVFNALRASVLDDKPITAKIVAMVVAASAAYAGNRHWTFKTRRREDALRQYLFFGIVNVAGMIPPLACLAISHYVLNWEGAIADNISANVVGLGIGSTLRFWLYHRWVFPEAVGETARRPEPEAA